MIGLFETFNMSPQDIALLWTSPLIAFVASLIRGWTSELDLSKPPEYEALEVDQAEKKLKQTKDNTRRRGYWVTGMGLAGAGIGFGLALLFLGAIQPTANAVCRVWLLALILGYTTPVVLRQLDAKVERALNKANDV